MMIYRLGSNDASMGAEVNFSFSSWNTLSWLFPHVKVSSFFVSSVKGAAVLEYSLMNCQ